MTVINMYEKITSGLLILIVIARTEEISIDKNVETADSSNSRLSTVLPFPYNDKYLINNNPKTSLVFLIPLSETQNKYEKTKETKIKRCGTQSRKNRFLLLSTKNGNNKIRTDKNINMGMSKSNLDDHTMKNAKYSQEKSSASKRMIETHEDEMLLQALQNNLNAEDITVNLKSQKETKKCNTDKYICHCKEENCFFNSLKKSSSEMLDSSTIDKSERTNHRELIKHKNMKSDVLQQKSPIYHENPHELPVSNMINHFFIQPYQENMNIPPVPILYGIIPNVVPYMIGKERKFINVPFTSFESSPNYLLGNNQYQPINRQKPCICSSIIEGHQDESYKPLTSPSTNYADATIRETTNDLESNNLIDQIEEDQEHLTTEAANEDSLIDSPLEIETPLRLNYLTDITKESNALSPFNLNEVTLKSEDFTDQTERNPDTNFPKLTTYSTDYEDVNSAPSLIYDGINDGKLINMEECIQLFGRDVCVLGASTSSKMLAKQLQENNLISNKYSTIRIPEYITQVSSRKETIDPYLASKSSVNGIDKSNININKYLEIINAKANADVDEAPLHEFDPESVEQISKPNINYDKNKLFNTINYITKEKSMGSTTDETTKTEKNKLLGKSKSHTTKLLLNPNDELTNSSSKKFLHSTPSNKSSSDEGANNLMINQQNRIINSESNISSKEETTIISCDSKTGFDSKEQNNPVISATPKPDSTETEEHMKNHHDEESVNDITHATNFMQETTPNYAQVPDGTILKNIAETNKDIGEKMEYILNEKTQLTSSTEIDPLIILERIKFNLPPIKYYSPEILKYATNHRTDDKNVEITTASTNSAQETSSNYAQMSDGVTLQNATEMEKNDGEVKYPLTTTASNLISPTNVEYRDSKPKTIYLTGENVLESQQSSQQKNFTDDIIKIHEVTTEVQRTYAKTTYFKAKSSTDSPSSSSLNYEPANIRVSNNDKENDNHNCGNNNNYSIDSKTNNTDNAMKKAKEALVSSSKSSSRDDVEPQQSPSSIAPDEDIAELQSSQLYYISDGVKLPLEIKKLEDGSYALLISKNICQQILTRKCHCCVPLQGYVVRSLKQEDIRAMTSTPRYVTEKKDQENTNASNVKRDYPPFNTMVTSMITRRKAVITEKSKEEKEGINAGYPSNRNDDDDPGTISMPVIDFAKKYNLLLDFGEEKIAFNKVELENKMQNYDKSLCLSLMKSDKLSEYDTQSEEKNLNNYPDIKRKRLVSENNGAIDRFQDLTNIREKKDTPNTNFPMPPIKKFFNLMKEEISQGLKSHEAKTSNGVRNTMGRINAGGREKTSPVQKGIDLAGRLKISEAEMKSDKLSNIAEGNTKVFRKKENREHEATELIGNEHNVPEIRNFTEDIGKPHRYQRNTNSHMANKRKELIKSMLYWFNDLIGYAVGYFLDK